MSQIKVRFNYLKEKRLEKCKSLFTVTPGNFFYSNAQSSKLLLNIHCDVPNWVVIFSIISRKSSKYLKVFIIP